MALRSGYKGIKKLAAGLKWNRPGILAADDTALAKVFFPRSEQAVLGAKNLLRPVLTTFTTNGVTFTVNEDKTITVNGTATADIYCPVFNREYPPELSQGTYLVSGGVAETANYKFYLQERNAGNTDWGRAYYDTTGEGVQYDRTTDVRYAVFIWIKSGATLNNVTFYPMITLASDTDRTYARYAMTNKELTDSAADQKTAINAIITAATGAADFDAFKTALGAITPVTRSLSMEASPDEDPAEVIDEKPVTKKTTKKTTVKEGE